MRNSITSRRKSRPGGVFVRSFLLPLLVLMAGILFSPHAAVRCLADTLEWTNEETGFAVYLEDQADLLTGDQETALLEKMKEVSAYAGAAFVTTDQNYGSAPDYAEARFRTFYRDSSAVLFLIDMSNRKIYIFSDGAAYQTITKTRSRVITDNVYTYASRQDYLGCAAEAFSQMRTLLEGGKIAQPMKYISNALIALLLSLLLCYIFVLRTAANSRATKQEILGAAAWTCTMAGVSRQLTSTHRKYSPRSHDSGGGGGGGGGFSGGGGGGGFSSGGGGGHSF